MDTGGRGTPLNAEHAPTAQEQAKLHEGLVALRDERPVAILFHPQCPDECLIAWKGNVVGCIRRLTLRADGRSIDLEIESPWVPEVGSHSERMRQEMREAGIAIRDVGDL